MTSSSSSSLKILEAPYGSPLFELVKQIRVAVFVDEQGYAASDEFDGYDGGCVHLLLVEQDVQGAQTPAGTLRYFPPSDTTKSEKMGRLAVAKQYRGRGLASQLLKELERMLIEGELEACKGKKVTEIQCNAQGERSGQAHRLGPASGGCLDVLRDGALSPVAQCLSYPSTRVWDTSRKAKNSCGSPPS